MTIYEMTEEIHKLTNEKDVKINELQKQIDEVNGLYLPQIKTIEDNIEKKRKHYLKTTTLKMNPKFKIFQREDGVQCILKEPNSPNENRIVLLWDGERTIGIISENNQMRINDFKIWFSDFIITDDHKYPIEIEGYIDESFNEQFVEIVS